MSKTTIKVITSKTGVFSFSKESAKEIAWAFGFTLLAILAPALLAHTPHNQWITGILVNLILFLTAAKTKTLLGLMPATIPSLIAVTRGLLPALLVPMIPFIILGNIVLMIVFAKFYSRNALGAVLIGAILKTALIAGASVLFFNLPQVIATMMQWPQLITALAGGLLALPIIKNRLFGKKISHDQQA